MNCIVFLKVNYPEGFPPADCHSALIHVYQQWEICKKGEENCRVEVDKNDLPIGHKFPIGTSPVNYFHWKVKKVLDC